MENWTTPGYKKALKKAGIKLKTNLGFYKSKQTMQEFIDKHNCEFDLELLNGYGQKAKNLAMIILLNQQEKTLTNINLDFLDLQKTYQKLDIHRTKPILKSTKLLLEKKYLKPSKQNKIIKYNETTKGILLLDLCPIYFQDSQWYKN